jgi:hypothetical protein
MFDRLKGLFEKKSDPEFKPRQQLGRSEPVVSSQVSMKLENTPDAGAMSVSKDPFEGKLDAMKVARVQEKMAKLKQLQKELGYE